MPVQRLRLCFLLTALLCLACPSVTPQPDGGAPEEDAGLPDAGGQELDASTPIDTLAPAWPQGSTLSAVQAGTTSVELSWSAATDDREVVAYRLLQDGAQVAELAGSSLSHRLTGLEPGRAYRFAVRAGDASGNASSDGPTATLTLTAPDPARLAPPLDRSVPASAVSTASFLYMGEDPPQIGVAPGALEPVRLAVLRGRVSQGNAPLEGVRISVLGHAELGHTFTRADGAFDLAVNGGGTLTVLYEKQGFPQAQRQVEVPWQDFTWLPDVSLVPYDSQVATIRAGASSAQVARGSPVADADGARTATLLFPAGTSAQMTLPDGSQVPLETLHVRATEYTVGAAGPASMPATLPASSGYTYAVELSVDEAAAAGAREVSFNQPLAFYVDNFLDFPVGSAVPSGYYDRQAGMWKATPDGVVLALIGEAGGLARLDVDGDGVEDGPQELAPLGVGDAERAELARFYEPGKSLWRVPISHFTSYDFNWPFVPPDDAQQPYEVPPPAGPVPPRKDPPVDEDCRQAGSIIGCETQSLGERVPLTGTPFSLHYASERMVGRKDAYSLTVPVTGSVAPPGLLGIRVEVQIAGQRLVQRAPTGPNQTVRMTWDGLDGYGRRVQGPQRALVSITYEYPYKYYPVSLIAGESSFGRPPRDRSLPRRDGRRLVPAERSHSWETTLGAWDMSEGAIGGWSLDVHHTYSAVDQTLYLGHGGRRSATLMGGSSSRLVPEDSSFTMAAHVSYRLAMATGPDGSLYVPADRGGFYQIARVLPHGTVEMYVGGGERFYEDAPRREKYIHWVTSLALGPDGSLYYGEWLGNVLRVGLDGMVRTVATMEPNQPANALAVGADGSLYIGAGQRVKRLGADGSLTLYAGSGGSVPADGSNGPATQVPLGLIRGLAAGRDGSLYIADATCYSSFCWSLLRRVDPAGYLTTIGGAGQRLPADGIPVRDAALPDMTALVPAPEGGLYMTSRFALFHLTSEGIINRIAGGGGNHISEEGPPRTRRFEYIQAVTAWQDGSVVVVDAGKLVRLGAALPSLATTERLIASEDGAWLHVFNANGRHVRTLDALSGTPVYEFLYDAAGRLVELQEGNGRRTRIERDGEGRPLAIVAPHGQRTLLDIGADGLLASVTNPKGERVSFSYAQGLLTARRDARGGLHTYTYDGAGRLTRDTGPSGSFKSLARTEEVGGYSVAVTSTSGLTTRYGVKSLSGGGQQRTTTSPAGEVSTTVWSPYGTTTSTAADGTTTSTAQGPDPRFGMQAPLVVSRRVTTPRGLTSTLSRSRDATWQDGLLATLTDTVAVNGHTSTITYEAATRRLTTTTPLGRQILTSLDDRGRVVRRERAGVLPVQYGYDSEDRLTWVAQGRRRQDFTYGPDGNLQRVVDALGRSVSFDYDLAGRLRGQELPGGRSLTFDRDTSGNLTAITPPGRPAHAFSYTPAGLEESYTAPTLPSGPATRTESTHDPDGRLRAIIFPDGSHLTLTYAADRLERSTLIPPDGSALAPWTVSATYDGPTGHLTTLTSPEGSLLYEYDGFLPLSEEWQGAVSGRIERTFTPDFHVQALTVAGVPFAHVYDGEGLLTQVGDLSLAWNETSGLLMGATLGQVSTTYAPNAYGEAESVESTLSGTLPLLRYTLVRDDAGRIVEKTESVLGEPATRFQYGHDAAGRLETVTKDGVLIARYSYDAQGNRTSAPLGATTVAATYDVQDRLQTFGPYSYTFGPNGDMRARQTESETTSYAYDALGHLRAVALPDGTRIEYVVDARGRRVGRKVDGSLVRGWLYDGQLRVVAELDGNGMVVSRFVYATEGHVPDYLVKGGITYRILSDHLGSPRLVVNTADGSVAQRLEYDAWGSVLVDTQPGFQPFGFAGGLYDSATRLVRLGARDYEPLTGRWMSRDPSRFGGGDTNLYAYAWGDPVNAIDVTGRFPYQRALVLAGGFATADGPLPFGDVVAAGILSATAVHASATVGYTVGKALVSLLSEQDGAAQPQAAPQRSKAKPKDTCPPQEREFPGWDARKAPEGFQWKGRGEQGSKRGNYHNDKTGESLHPDLEHEPPIGPHWDWWDGLGGSWRIFPNGRIEPK